MKLSEHRFNRKLRKREQYLRLMANRADSVQSSAITIHDNAKKSLFRQTIWTCDFCEREFHSYTALLNHKCAED